MSRRAYIPSDARPWPRAHRVQQPKPHSHGRGRARKRRWCCGLPTSVCHLSVYAPIISTILPQAPRGTLRSRRQRYAVAVIPQVDARASQVCAGTLGRYQPCPLYRRICKAFSLSRHPQSQSRAFPSQTRNKTMWRQSLCTDERPRVYHRYQLIFMDFYCVLDEYYQAINKGKPPVSKSDNQEHRLLPSIYGPFILTHPALSYSNCLRGCGWHFPAAMGGF